MKKSTVLILTALVVLTFMGRVYSFREKSVITYDEVVYSTMAVQVSEDPSQYNAVGLYHAAKEQGRTVLPYFKKPLFKHPPMFTYLIAVSYKIFGTTYNSAFLVSLFFGTLLILTAYFLGAILFDERTGLYAALLMSIEPVIWIVSQKIWIAATLSFFTVMSLCFFAAAIKKYDPRSMIAGGISAGFAVLTKYPGFAPVLAMFIYALFCDRSLFRRLSFWAALAVPFFMLMPWLWWNYQVYGSQMFSGNVEIMRFVGGLRAAAAYPWFLPFVIAAVLASAVLKKYGSVLVNASRRVTRFAVLSIPVVVFIALLFVIRKNLANICTFSFMPVHSWDMGFFKNEPWYFYFSRLTELSPFYLFSFAALMFPLFHSDKKRSYMFLLVVVAIVLIPGIFWRNFQSRYIAPVVVPLIVLSAGVQVRVLDAAMSIKRYYLRHAAEAVIILVIFYVVVRTLFVDIDMAIPNNVCYF